MKLLFWKHFKDLIAGNFKEWNHLGIQEFVIWLEFSYPLMQSIWTALFRTSHKTYCKRFKCFLLKVKLKQVLGWVY